MIINATFWVAVSFFIYLGVLIYLKVPQKINNSLIDQINEETKKPTPRIYNLADTDYDPVVHYSTIDELNEKLAQALQKSLEWDNKIPTGIFY